MGSGSKSYMRKSFLIYEKMRKYFTIYEEAVSHTCLAPSQFPYIWGKCYFFFLSVHAGNCLPFVEAGVMCTFSKTPAAAGIGKPRSWAAPCQGRRYSTTWQAVRPAHHTTNYRPSTPLLDRGRVGRHVGSALYGLRPLCYTVHLMFDPLQDKTPRVRPCTAYM